MNRMVFLFLVAVILMTGCPAPDEDEGSDEIGIVGLISYFEDFEETDIRIFVFEEATIYSEDVFTGTLISDAAVTINNIEI
ncbi:MAG: hypothetical protein JXB88_13205, partial [Spirochaetales bacterium]|nr:hypothetical protein [Spirochaetales bacterium]